jgi:O-antigen/teichoic acid export membrane protein
MSRLARNILYNLAGQGALLVLSFVAVRFIYRQLGDDALGIVFFALTFSNVVAATMDLGISSTIVREVAARQGSSPAYVERLLRTAASFYWTCYVILATTLFLMAGTIAQNWLNPKTLDSAKAKLSLQILAIGCLLSLPRSLYASLFRGLQRMGVSNSIEAGSLAIQQAGTVAIIAVGGSLVAVSYWIAGSTAVGVGAYIVAASRAVPLKALWPGLDIGVLKTNRDFASHMTLVSILAMVQMQADKLIVSRLLPLGTFGLYAFGSSAVNRGMLLTAAVAQAAFPSLSQLHGESGSRENLLDRYLRLQDVISYAAAVVFAVTPFATRPVLELLFGPAQAHAMLLPATLLALGFYMNSTLNMPYFLSVAVGKPGIALSLNAWALVVILPVTVLLVRWWSLNGAALSWVVYHVFAYAFFVPRVCRECTDGQVARWYFNVAKFFIPAVLIYGTAWISVVLFAPYSPIWLGVAYAGATLFYASLCWRLLSKRVRERLRSVAFLHSLEARTLTER